MHVAVFGTVILHSFFFFRFLFAFDCKLLNLDFDRLKLYTQHFAQTKQTTFIILWSFHAMFRFKDYIWCVFHRKGRMSDRHEKKQTQNSDAEKWEMENSVLASKYKQFFFILHIIIIIELHEKFWYAWKLSTTSFDYAFENFTMTSIHAYSRTHSIMKVQKKFVRNDVLDI